ncbi:hypothetical protein F4823DRAFT_155562 [Ustulina deusta]|nr:hypothetical protein F4823DRAFT_155562 [Ustulina deusta]
MPPTKKGHKNTSGVSRRTANGVFYADGKYLCQKIENGKPCNREMAATSHSISSHNCHFHADGPYRRQMAQGDFVCLMAGCNHRSRTFAAILAHIRRRHDFKGSSDPLKTYYGIPLVHKRKHEEAKEDDRKENTPYVKEDGHEKNLQEVEDENDAVNESDDYEGYDLIDPILRKWDRDNHGPGNGGSGNGGSSLGGQILSSHIVTAASG